MGQCTRRGFITRSLTTTSGLLWASNVRAKVRGANDDIRVAIVGLRKKGKEHIDSFRKLPGVRIVALCDCDTQFLDFETRQFKQRNEAVRTYVDYRKLLDDQDIDAVVLPVPDHWHALMTIWACQAGKDVFIEKPASYSIWEGRKMIEAARKYKRIVQVGSQNRSDAGLQALVPYIQQGSLGPVQRVRCFCYNRRESIGKVSGPQPVPSTCDYDLFQGPAPLTPLLRKDLHYDWHWFWDTGTGEMGNIGAHLLDHARWIIGQEALAPRAVSLGGRFGYDDDGQTPNTQIAFFDYRPVPMIYEIRGLPRRKGSTGMDTYQRLRASTRIECEGGFFAGGRGGGWAYDRDGKKIKQFKGDGGPDHQGNFIRAMRTRNVADLRADIEVGHTSAILCHMANISYRLGRRQAPHTIRQALRDNDLLTDAFERMLSHLDANGVDLSSHPAAIGPVLTFDAERERFVGDAGDEANTFLKRRYRRPFVVPEEV